MAEGVVWPYPSYRFRRKGASARRDPLYRAALAPSQRNIGDTRYQVDTVMTVHCHHCSLEGDDCSDDAIMRDVSILRSVSAHRNDDKIARIGCSRRWTA
eukprot:657168-Prorocentrum_minimum.AAC.1